MEFNGILFFPVTPFDAAGTLNEAALEHHLLTGLRHRPGGVFAACGTGEVHALSTDEHARVVHAAVTAAAGRVPVVAGAGGSVRTAIEQAATARDLGADGVLLLPPYLVGAPQRGLVDYVRAVAEAVPVPIIAYQRGSMVLTVDSAVAIAEIPGVAGIKDGVGDLDRMQQIVSAVRERRGADFTFFNGLPTAELTVRAYSAIGVPLYSSAAFAFVPEVATAFYRAVREGDPLADTLLDVFYRPLVRLRDRTPGYAVALVKAGVRSRGADVGGVRPPFVDPTGAEEAELDAVIAAGLAAARDASGAPC
ncbi:5-dehydro-4-deoxyglucarate dehydratase [Spinactinospora alkalitolerans]|uniref:Probable 5-dehydro-4-deoxyglucarate dehydratase n=1 Tax=Spinactinospora alkalitolerans TaxID=687207 RepID=A0A852TUW5_9ACTN|nr:5-dehydro-4-deoxyglucarate dehydratase [Spinactinospora alkalitolerans]NYE47195.1 5-dehydro-4-deoxyglucarate dehydratase [Spinactinospora alkalitolerans]